MTRFIVVTLALVAGCKGKDSAKTDDTTAAKPAAPGSASAAPAGSGSAPAAAPGSAASADERCADPCRFLATVALADITAEVKKTCGLEWKAPPADDCDQPDYLRNCIYANAGYTFKKRTWNQAFGATSWYKPRADFKESDLSKVATANVAALKKQAADCRGAHGVKPEDLAIVEKWADGVRAGKPEVPAIAFINERVDPKELRDALVGMKGDFKKGKKTQYWISQWDWDGAFAGKTIRGVEFFPGNAEPQPPCPDGSECEDGRGLIIAIDETNKIVGVALQISACPSVYVAGVYQGEILRNLMRPGRERWQGLAVTLPCDGDVVRFRIAEEKAETTELDALELVIDGETVAPLACGAACSNDGIATTLRQGEAIDVAFAVPAAARCRRAILRANGHYVPVSAAAATR